MKVSRLQLTAPLSHLRFLILPLFYLLTVLSLHLLIFLLLLPSAAEVVQTTETCAGEGHGLPDELHPRRPAEGGGGERGGGGGERGIKTLFLHQAICQDMDFSPAKSFERMWISGIKEEERGSHSFMHVETKGVF